MASKTFTNTLNPHNVHGKTCVCIHVCTYIYTCVHTHTCTQRIHAYMYSKSIFIEQKCSRTFEDTEPVIKQNLTTNQNNLYDIKNSRNLT